MSDHCHACILCGLPVDEDLSDYIPNWQAEAWMLSDRLSKSKDSNFSSLEANILSLFCPGTLG